MGFFVFGQGITLFLVAALGWHEVAYVFFAVTGLSFVLHETHELEKREQQKLREMLRDEFARDEGLFS